MAPAIAYWCRRGWARVVRRRASPLPGNVRSADSIGSQDRAERSPPRQSSTSRVPRSPCGYCRICPATTTPNMIEQGTNNSPADEEEFLVGGDDAPSSGSTCMGSVIGTVRRSRRMAVCVSPWPSWARRRLPTSPGWIRPASFPHRPAGSRRSRYACRTSARPRHAEPARLQGLASSRSCWRTGARGGQAAKLVHHSRPGIVGLVIVSSKDATPLAPARH